jgi:sirohydrochlorin cobaltochelatase
MTAPSSTAPVTPVAARATPLLVVGHGTRDPVGAAAFRDFVDHVGWHLGRAGVEVAGGFIELSRPPLTDAVGQLVERGFRHVAAVPLMLAAAGHGKGDIPGAMAREQVRFPGLTYRYGRPLGPHPILLDIMETLIDRALTGVPRAGTTVVLVGRGSSDPDANAEVAKVARLLWEGRGYDGVETAFVSLARPSVPECLERARLLGARRVVVAPYLLFAGVLPDRVVAQSAAWAAARTAVDVRVAGLLGAEPDALAALVAERYHEALHGDIRMNCDTCAYRIAMPGVEAKVGAPQRPHDHPDDRTHDGHGSHGSHGHGHGGHEHDPLGRGS